MCCWQNPFLVAPSSGWHFRARGYIMTPTTTFSQIKRQNSLTLTSRRNGGTAGSLVGLLHVFSDHYLLVLKTAWSSELRVDVPRSFAGAVLSEGEAAIRKVANLGPNHTVYIAQLLYERTHCHSPRVLLWVFYSRSSHMLCVCTMPM